MRSNEQTSSHLSAFIEDVCQTSHLRVEADLGDGFVRLRSDEAERRQAAHDIRSSEDIVIEMLRNSRDAGAHTIYLATTKAGTKRSIVVVDDGVGVPRTHHELIFEPRVTSKLDSVHMDKWGIHGRGMALYSISVNAEKAYVALSEPGMGAALAVQSDTSTLKEKVDQSTFPLVALTEKQRAAIRGPHNINRTAVEFALEHRKDIDVFLGSPAEIAATMYARGNAMGKATARQSVASRDEAPIVQRLCFAKSDKDFAALCASMGLEMSARTARRIMDGQIAPVQSLAQIVEDMIMGQVMQGESSDADASPRKSSVKRRTARAPKISATDLEAVESAVRDSFADIAASYYLASEVPIEAKVTHGMLRISIPLVNMDE